MRSLCLPLLFTGLLFSPLAVAQDKPADAIAMVDKGLAFMKKNGKEALIKEINVRNPDYVQGELYLYMRAVDGTVVAHPVNAKLVGKNMITLPDAEGKYFRKEIIDRAQSEGKGWVDYSYNNPVSKVIEKKSTYFVKSGDVILEAGIYKGK
ncbi:MAG: cache domain-containing protein [Pseudomonadota bacterium]